MSLNLGGILGGIVKTVGGAVGGLLTGGPVGAVAGGIAGLGSALGGRRTSSTPGQTIAMPGGFTGIGDQPGGGWTVGGFPVPAPGGGSMQFPVPVRQSPTYGGATGFGPAMPSPGAGPSLKGADLLGPRIFPATSAQMVGRYAAIPGYALVELPWDLGQYKRGTKMYMAKDDARRLGLWKKRPRPYLTHADVKALRKADRVEKKLVSLTRRHTDYRVTSKLAAARASAKKPASRRR